MYACPFAFSFSFHFFPALLLLSLYPSWLARKRWLTFSTPHNPVTLCSRRRLLFLFFLFFFLQEGSFEASYLASSFSYLAFFFYRSSPLVGFPSLFVIFELPGVLHTYYCQSSWRSRQCTVPERRLYRFHTHTQREKVFSCLLSGRIRLLFHCPGLFGTQYLLSVRYVSPHLTSYQANITVFDTLARRKTKSPLSHS